MRLLLFIAGITIKPPFLFPPKGERIECSCPLALLRRSGYAKAQGEGWEGGNLSLQGHIIRSHPRIQLSADPSDYIVKPLLRRMPLLTLLLLCRPFVFREAR